MNTMHKTQILKIDIRVPGANGMPFIRALTDLINENTGVIILDSANTLIGQIDGLEHSTTVISIGDSVDPADRFEFMRAVLY